MLAGLAEFQRGTSVSPIYLDANATTPVLPAVLDAMRPFLLENYGNPVSAHVFGRRARQALEDAREQVAALLQAYPDEVVFTSGATEANNLALFGLAEEPPGQLISSALEHPCVTEPLRRLGEQGFVVELLPVTHTGVIEESVFTGRIIPETRLVTLMLANHETGAVQPVGPVAAWLAGRVPLHCDAAQAVGRMPVAFHDLGVTTLSLSAHKFHGPKGIGALLVRRHTRLRPLLHGGHQQRERRPGTEPVALAVGLAKALELAHNEANERRTQLLKLREQFLARLRAEAAPVVLNGPEAGGIPHTVNLAFPGCQSDVLLMNLDMAGVACSTGSACSSGSLLPSPVLQAMGCSKEVLHASLRFSLSHLLTEADIDEACQRIVTVVRRLRDAT